MRIPSLVRRYASMLPSGGALPDDVWQKRRTFLLWLTWFHAAAIALIGPLLGYSWELRPQAIFRDDYVLHTVAEGFVVAAFALIATWNRIGRTLQACALAVGLMSSSAILVHLSGGYIEFHFHFFVMLAFLALLQDWAPYLVAIAYVAIHHGVVGVLWPEEVFNHPAAFNAPWTWAAVHAFFIVGSCIGSVIAWRFNEVATEKIQQQAAELESVNTLQADFVAIVAHDLRSPINNMAATASMMKNGLFGEINTEQARWLTKIEESSETMVEIINDFLDISKMEAGRLDLVKEKIDVYQLVRSSLENFIPLAKARNISLISRLEPSLPTFSADARRLDQVLTNLLSNAVKFTPDGREIEVGARRTENGITLWVRDDGVGIAAEEIGLLFDKYRQTKSGRVSAHKGTGLGLAICKMIVQAHGGKIWVESRPGVGSTFALQIPL